MNVLQTFRVTDNETGEAITPEKLETYIADGRMTNVVVIEKLDERERYWWVVQDEVNDVPKHHDGHVTVYGMLEKSGRPMVAYLPTDDDVLKMLEQWQNP